jgi:hypothetical protein
MPFYHGKGTKVYIDSYEVSTYMNNAQMTGTAEPSETTTFTDSSKEFIKGLTAGTMTLGGLYESTTDIDPTSGTNKKFDEFLNSLVSAANPSVVTVVPYTMAAGSWVKGAYARMTSFDITAPVADVVSLDTSWECGHNGSTNAGVQYANVWGAASLTTGSAVTPSASSGGTSGSTVDSGASSAKGYICSWHVIANSSNVALDIKVQHSTNGSSWSDLVTLESSLGAAALTSGITGASGTVNRYLRFNVPQAGSYSSGTITPIITLHRISATQA